MWFFIFVISAVGATEFGANVGTGLVRDFLHGNFLRNPIAVVIEDNPKAIHAFRNLWPLEDWKESQDVTFFLVKDTGIVKLMKNASSILSKTKERDLDEMPTIGPVFLGTLKAVQFIPFDSGILLVVANEPTDTDLAEVLLLGLLHKRSRLFTIWSNPEEQGDEIIKNITLQSGGSFYYYNKDILETKRNSKLHEDKEETKITTTEEDSSFIDEKSRQKRFAFPNGTADNEKQKMLKSSTGKIVTTGLQQKAFGVNVPFIVELATGSNLEIAPGTSSQIVFDVINTQGVPVYTEFQAYGQGVTITSTNPNKSILDPNVPLKVQLTVHPLGSGEASITLTAIGPGQKPISRRAILRTSLTAVSDIWAPELKWKFNGDCSNFNKPTNCESGHWSLDVTAKDETSGLLRLMSDPFGMLFRTEFIAGSKSPSTATYTATCCRPRVDIWAEDLKGNYNKKTFDVFNQVLYAGEIASIVLAILLLILLIAFIVLLVIYCRKRKSDRHVLPRHRSS